MVHANSCEKGFKKSRLTVQIEIQNRTGKESSYIKSKPKCPQALRYLWDLYIKVFSGCEKIGYIELNAFNQLTKTNISDKEAQILIQIDKLRLNDGSN